MVVGPCRSVSLTGVMMLPQQWQTRGLMDRSRCPAPLTSPKHSHVWNWFCCHYLPVTLLSHCLPHLPPPQSLSVCQNRKYLIIKTQDNHVLMRTLSATDRWSVFKCRDSAVLNLCMIDGAPNARSGVFCCPVFSFPYTWCSTRQTD